jgi:recombination protein RecA
LPGEDALSFQRKEQIELIAAEIRKRWGARALTTLGTASLDKGVQVIPSGFSALNHALGIGGIPRSHITELIGTPTSGIATIALKVIAHAQAVGDVAAYLDLSKSLDADYAARCGVALDRLLIIRPQHKEKTLEMLYELVEKRVAGVIVFDAVSSPSKSLQRLTSSLRRTTHILADSLCAILFLTPSPGGMLPHEATVRLTVQRDRWLADHSDIQGYVSQVVVIKNIFAPVGREILINLNFEDVVLGDAA